MAGPSPTAFRLTVATLLAVGVAHTFALSGERFAFLTAALAACVGSPVHANVFGRAEAAGVALRRASSYPPAERTPSWFDARIAGQPRRVATDGHSGVRAR